MIVTARSLPDSLPPSQSDRPSRAPHPWTSSGTLRITSDEPTVMTPKSSATTYRPRLGQGHRPFSP